MSQQLRTGDGWRLGWNSDAVVYSGLLSSDNWSIELTSAEFKDFCRLARSLNETMMAMASQLMAEERLCCEQESETIWLEADGFPGRYTLRFILLSGRRAEGAWTAEQVIGLIAALKESPFDALE